MLQNTIKVNNDMPLYSITDSIYNEILKRLDDKNKFIQTETSNCTWSDSENSDDV